MGLINDLNNLPSKQDYDPLEKHKPDILKSLVHAADIGNPARPFELCKFWCFKVLKEFFAQGDKERSFGLEISMLCDRRNTNIATS